MLRSLLLSLVALFVFVCVLGCATSSAPDDSNPSRTDARDTTTDAVFEAASDVFPPSPMCGNGRLEAGEACDDGNTQSGDGCRSDCQRIETDWICPQPGMGGVHGAESGSVTLDAATATRFGLTVGRVYEIVVFQAERHTVDSNYRLTLGGFNLPRSRCASVCGDGVVTPDEACDDGTNDGRYGGCMPGCLMRAPHCGDGVLQRDQGEQCDDGNMVNEDGCSSRCQTEVIG